MRGVSGFRLAQGLSNFQATQASRGFEWKTIVFFSGQFELRGGEVCRVSKLFSIAI